MSTEEVFKKLSGHMLEGMMLHEQLANYFNFLALEGYKRCHEYHYLEETNAHRMVQEYYINHFNKLLPWIRPNTTDIIPQSWYPHVRQDVDEGTRREGIRGGLGRWRDWEAETKRLYQDLFGALLSIGEIAVSEVLRELVADVDGELAEAEELFLECSAVSFDLAVIVPDQGKKFKEYSKKIKKIDF